MCSLVGLQHEHALVGSKHTFVGSQRALVGSQHAFVGSQHTLVGSQRALGSQYDLIGSQRVPFPVREVRGLLQKQEGVRGARCQQVRNG